jgi:ornithine cyclodeaminase/alanine dehydrogenase
LSAVVTGADPGRLAGDEITLFKSVGTGAQDLMVAGLLLELAEAEYVGTVLVDVNAVKPA